MKWGRRTAVASHRGDRLQAVATAINEVTEPLAIIERLAVDANRRAMK
jgi:hypothetical protein